MSRTHTFEQTRDPDPDYSNEEERAELAARLLDTVPELIAMDPTNGVVEACARVGFNGFDCETLRLLARRTGEFPMSIERREATATEHPKYTIRLGWAWEGFTVVTDREPGLLGGRGAGRGGQAPGAAGVGAGRGANGA